MKVIVGLGNPGRRYSKTRHNLGFMVIDELASIYGIKLKRKGFDSLWGEGYFVSEKVILAKPQTFMNLSGKAVRNILKGQNAESSDLLVIYDDMDLELSNIRIKLRGGSGGHKGINSVINTLRTDYFARIRIGIGRPSYEDAEEYVLSPFRKHEIPKVTEAIHTAVQAIEMIIKDGVTAAVNKYNARSPHFTPPVPVLPTGRKGGENESALSPCGHGS